MLAFVWSKIANELDIYVLVFVGVLACGCARVFVCVCVCARALLCFLVRDALHVILCHSSDMQSCVGRAAAGVKAL